MRQLTVASLLLAICLIQGSIAFSTSTDNTDSGFYIDQTPAEELKARQDAGIQVSFTPDAFTSIFKGFAEFFQTQINDIKTNVTYHGFTLFVNHVNLTSFELDANSSQTKFVAANRLRVKLNFQRVVASFHNSFLFFHSLPVFGKGSLTDDGLSISFDLSISSNPNGSIKFGITSLFLNPGKMQINLKNPFLQAFGDIFFNLTDFALDILKPLISVSIQKYVAKFFSQVPTSLTVPGTEVILNTQLVAPSFSENGFMNLAFSGNSYINGTDKTPLNPISNYNPQDFGSSFQIFVDEQVLNKLVANLLTSNPQFNITLPQVASSTTPVDSHSLLPVLPGLKSLKKLNYPIIEALLNSTSISLAFNEDSILASAQIGLNFFFEQANDNSTTFLYNSAPAYARANITFDLINQNNYITPRLKDLSIFDLVVAPEDAKLFDVKQITSLLPFFDQLVKDTINMILFPEFINFESLFGQPVEKANIQFLNKHLHVELLF